MTVFLNAQNQSQLQWAVDRLKNDECVALPTETVYGLAARAFSEKALAKIFALKNRPLFDPLIVHVRELADIKAHLKSVTPLHEKLIEAFWPGPLTLLFEKKDSIPDLCTAGSPFVGIRAPGHKVFRQILQMIGEPLAAPSANRFARISPTSAEDVIEELAEHGLEAVVDGGPCAAGIESTVVKVLSHQAIQILRPGALSLEQIKTVLGPSVEVRFGQAEKIEAPGQIESHYAPKTSLEFIEQEEALSRFQGINLSRLSLLLAYPDPAWLSLPWGNKAVLSSSGSDLQAAALLFKTMRELDQKNFDRIVAVKAPERGLGLAINDRLRRASKKLSK